MQMDMSPGMKTLGATTNDDLEEHPSRGHDPCDLQQRVGRPGARRASAPDVPISHHDRVYAAEQFSNTVSVTDPVDNKLLGVIKLGDPQPGQFQSALQGAGSGPWHGLFARSSDAGGGFDRIEFRDLHRHGHECREARDLCRPLAA